MKLYEYLWCGLFVDVVVDVIGDEEVGGFVVLVLCD